MLSCAISFVQASEQSNSDFTLPYLLDNNLQSKLSDYRGQYVYLDFWASWCPPCRRSFPLYQSLYQSLKAENFTIVAVSVDESLDDAKRFIKKNPVDFPLLWDPKSLTPEQFGVMTMPTSFMIDPDGKVLWRHLGFKKKHYQELVQKIEKAVRLGFK